MKKENKVLICSVLTLLQERDPDWKYARMVPKFKVLYDAWRQADMRKYKRNSQFYSIAWKRGWLAKADFNRFRKYAMQ